jgi:cytochrome c nitrite reductase small subunit
MREQYDSWTKSSHHAVAGCVDCHIPHEFVPKYLVKLENGYAHSTAFTFQNFDEPIRIRDRNARVLEANCVACHRATVGGLLAQQAHNQHDHAKQDHDERDHPKSCVHCHISVGHAAIR